MAEELNELLRTHVIRVGFNLSLGKTHVAALVWIDFAIRNDKGGHWRARGILRSPSGGPWNNFATGTHGLIDRGLVTHRYDDVKLPRGVRLKSELPFRRFWKITPAGRHVLGLLKESGLYSEYLSQISPLQVLQDVS